MTDRSGKEGPCAFENEERVRTSTETNNLQPKEDWLWLEAVGGMHGADPMKLITETHRVWGPPGGLEGEPLHFTFENTQAG